MDAGVAASSAYWTAALRARETGRPDRLFADEFAADLAGDLGRDLLQRKERRQGREDVLIPVRTRWFDDAVLDAVPATGAQLVELGAGLDTRPYRLPLPVATRVFELDQEPVLRHKAEVLAGKAVARDAVADVPVDLGADWASPLTEAGFASSGVTVWVAEGLLMYLTLDAGRRLLRTAAGLSGPGSILILDTLARRGPAPNGSERAGARFCPDDLDSLLGEQGWTVRVRTTIAEPARAYGRLPVGLPAPRQPSDVSYHLVVAELAGPADRSGPRPER